MTINIASTNGFTNVDKTNGWKSKAKNAALYAAAIALLLKASSYLQCAQLTQSEDAIDVSPQIADQLEVIIGGSDE